MRRSVRQHLLFLGLTAAALLIHGYHLGSDDGALYVPAIKKVADPALYPKFTDFFLAPGKLSLFPELVGWTSRVSHIAVDWVIFAFYCFSLYLLFSAAYTFLSLCFSNHRARLAGLCLLAIALAVPVAGTALILDDPYLTARSLVLPLSLYAVSAFLGNRFRTGMLWLIASAAIHPEAIYAAGLCGSILFVRRFQQARPAQWTKAAVAAALLFPLTFSPHPAVGAYGEVLASRAYLNVLHWEWFEWIGAAAPFVLFMGFARLKNRCIYPPLKTICFAAILSGVCFTSAAIVLGSQPIFESLIRFQPMRCLHLLYLLLFLIAGAMLGEFVLRRAIWRWCVLFFPLSASIYALNVREYAFSPHIEFPGVHYKSGYLQAFLWIRENTPKDAVFGLDPEYTAFSGVDMHGFGAFAERSSNANRRKDSGTVSVFPQFADEWKRQVTAAAGWSSFSAQQFETFTGRYGIQWIVVAQPRIVSGWDCPYSNREVKVCKKLP